MLSKNVQLPNLISKVTLANKDDLIAVICDAIESKILLSMVIYTTKKNVIISVKNTTYFYRFFDEMDVEFNKLIKVLKTNYSRCKDFEILIKTEDSVRLLNL